MNQHNQHSSRVFRKIKNPLDKAFWFAKIKIVNPPCAYCGRCRVCIPHPFYRMRDLTFIYAKKSFYHN